MHKMLFNTGVRPINRQPFKLGEFEELKGGTVHIAYYLNSKPKENYQVQFLAPLSYLEHKKTWEFAMRIVGGGMMSDIAVFHIMGDGDLNENVTKEIDRILRNAKDSEEKDNHLSDEERAKIVDMVELNMPLDSFAWADYPKDATMTEKFVYIIYEMV